MRYTRCVHQLNVVGVMRQVYFQSLRAEGGSEWVLWWDKLAIFSVSTTLFIWYSVDNAQVIFQMHANNINEECGLTSLPLWIGSPTLKQGAVTQYQTSDNHSEDSVLLWLFSSSFELSSILDSVGWFSEDVFRECASLFNWLCLCSIACAGAITWTGFSIWFELLPTICELLSWDAEGWTGLHKRFIKFATTGFVGGYEDEFDVTEDRFEPWDCWKILARVWGYENVADGLAERFCCSRLAACIVCCASKLCCCKLYWYCCAIVFVSELIWAVVIVFIVL